MAAKENILGTVPIPKLLRQFAIPSVISMLVNSVYNMVDQIFIGQKIGYLGNGATSVTFPFVTIFMAIGLMIAVGSAANTGLCLGRREQDRADRTLGNGLLLAVLAGVVLLTIAQVFLVPCLRAFGATDIILPYAVSYARIYTIGVPFVTIGVMINDEIRVDGNPRYAMISMLAGAILNVILDYLFVFPMEMGVAGAALASILGQLLTLCIAAAYLRRFKTIKLQLSNLRPDAGIIKGIALLGLPSFLTQVSNLFVHVIINNQSIRYGSQTIYGAEIPLAVFGIVMKINAIMFSLILGTSIGAQPIFSFNFGAAKYDRVKELVKYSLIVTTIIGVAGMLVMQIFPQQVISIFGQEDALYNEFAVHALRTMTILIFILGVQMTTNSYFQSVGKSRYAMLVTISRQFIFMIPLLFILPLFISVDGIMYAFVLADLGTVILCTVLLTREMRLLGRLISDQEKSDD